MLDAPKRAKSIFEERDKYETQKTNPNKKVIKSNAMPPMTPLGKKVASAKAAAAHASMKKLQQQRAQAAQ